MKTKILRDNLYHVEVRIYYDCMWKDVVKKLNLEEDEEEGSTRVIHGAFVKDECALFFEKGVDISTIAHETIHLVLYILDTSDVPLNIYNQEAIAYYYEFWLLKILKALNIETNTLPSNTKRHRRY